MRTRSTLVLSIGVSLVACTPRAVATHSEPSPTTQSSTWTTPLAQADRARQALSRLTFGARPGDLALVQRIGVDAWLDQQLHPERMPDPVADSVLNLLEITHKTAFDLAAEHPAGSEYNPAVFMTQVNAPSPPKPGDTLAKLGNLKLDVRAASLQNELNTARANIPRELAPSIVLRAAVSERQLLEVMTVFWENHFSVSVAKMPTQFALIDYDHEIRAHALGKFRDLLHAVATSPAMLFYLDNAQSSVDSLHPTPIEWRAEQRRALHPPFGDASLITTAKRRRNGLNENYARELMELHTLGVDGGYTQKDVQEVARCLTGWTIENQAFGGSFAFQPALHDAGEKTVLGVYIPGGRGVEDGEQVLDILVRHPSTARFLAKKLVTYLVTDRPPQSLVDRVAQVYLKTDGDIAAMIRTIATSPEFNSRAAYRAKVKTPFELVASMLRVMTAAPDTTQQAPQLVARMGQPMFGHMTPEGWPDDGAAWMNTGALMNRINLAQQVGRSEVGIMRLSNWAPRQRLLQMAITMTSEQQADAVIDALLAGDASAETRKALIGVSSPAGNLVHLGELVSIVLGSSDFQRR